MAEPTGAYPSKAEFEAAILARLEAKSSHEYMWPRWPAADEAAQAVVDLLAERDNPSDLRLVPRVVSPVAEPTDASSTSWRCRHGWHSYFFVSMSDVRMVEVPPHSSWICDLTERCARCGITRRRRSADVPKRPRVRHSADPRSDGRDPEDHAYDGDGTSRCFCGYPMNAHGAT